MIDIINATAKAAAWKPHPSPHPGARRTGTEPVTGRGQESSDIGEGKAGRPMRERRGAVVVLGHRAQPQLGRVRLPDDDRAGFPQPPDVSGVVVGGPVAKGA